MFIRPEDFNNRVVSPSPLRSCGLALSVITAVGCLAIAAVGAAGCVGALSSLSQVQAISILSAGGVLGLGSLIYIARLMKQCSFTDEDLVSLDEWVKEASFGENRAEAKRRILACKEDRLSLSHLRLETLPKEIGKLTQLKWLYLDDNQLRELPPEIWELTQLEWLFLRCNQLRELPAEIGELSQLEGLILRNNQLSALPNSIFRLPQECIIDLESNQFSAATIVRIQDITREEGYSGPRFNLSIRDQSRKSRPLPVLLEQLRKDADKPPLQLTNLAESEELTSWLNRLVDVGDYKKSESRQALCVRIYEVIQAADQDSVFREIFLAIISGAAATCGDRVALSILYADLQLQIKEAGQDLPKLAHLLRTSMALDILEEIAREKERSLKAVDPIEVYLAYPVMLKEKLDLSIVLDSMLYFGCAGVTQEDLDNAQGLVKSIIDNRETYINYLVNNQTWVDALKSCYGSEVQEIMDQRDSDDMKKMTEYRKALFELTERTLLNSR